MFTKGLERESFLVERELLLKNGDLGSGGIYVFD